MRETLPFGIWPDGAPGRSFWAMVTEPRSSFTEAVGKLAAATGRTIRYTRISTGRCAAVLAGPDVPEEVVVRLRRVVIELLDDRHADQPPGVGRSIGR